jgi:quinol monooxygenase YgiN
MPVARREFLCGAAGLLVAGSALAAPRGQQEKMFGVIGKLVAQPGERERLIAILLEGTRAMPGCLSYIVARDQQDADALWITEVWESKESHAASLALPAVKEAIARGRPLIASFGERFTTQPAGGIGL